MRNAYLPERARVQSVRNETSDTKTFRVGYPIKHGPGQFVEVSLPGYGEAPISICSYSKRYIELCVRDVGTLTHKMMELKQGDTVYVRGPYGNGYPMDDMRGYDIVVIGGGTGVGPTRSVLEYLEENRKRYGTVDVFFGFRTPADVLFKYDMKKWEKNMNLNLTVDEACDGWTCSIGVVTKILEEADLNPKNKTVVSCGPPIMIKYVIELLKKQGFTNQQIYVSLERLMKCGIGKCGHCMVGDKYVCRDGPVFNLSVAKDLMD